MPESSSALRNANPRTSPDFEQLVAAAKESVTGQIAVAPAPDRQPGRRRLVPATLTAALVAVAIAAAFLTIGSPAGEDASAAFERAAAQSAASAEQAGTAVVRITHEGRPWAGTTVRWNGNDLSLGGDFPRRPGKVGRESLVVDGVMYGQDERTGEWVELGPTSSIDPGSGTTPDEYLAAVRQDVGGATLQRITGAMTDPAVAERNDGSTVYSGTIAAGVIAPETGFKEGRMIRVLPFGYVAHDQAANARSPLAVAVTVGPEGFVREIRASWGSWVYSVRYSSLGATPAIAAPASARPLRERLREAKEAKGA
jgi:hypothetical protein